MSDADRVSWEEFLSPEVLRFRLAAASLYIAAFQVLKDSRVGRIQGFYMVSGSWREVFRGHESDYRKYHEKYQSEVLARNPSLVYACLDWLKESQAISDEDISAFESIKALRNKIAHAFPGMLTGGLPSELTDRFTGLVSLLDKIERWWIVNVDSDRGIDEREVAPGRVIGLRLMVDIALGPEKRSRNFLEEFIGLTRLARPS